MIVLKRLALIAAGGVVALSLGWFIFCYVGVLGELLVLNCP
jgi:hypothetical protein